MYLTAITGWTCHAASHEEKQLYQSIYIYLYQSILRSIDRSLGTHTDLTHM